MVLPQLILIPILYVVQEMTFGSQSSPVRATAR